MKPMLPTLTFDVPKGKDWVYEIKYDGFRAILQMDHLGIKMMSRNGKNLLPQFPEANQFFEKYKETFSCFFPILFDGELTILQNDCKSDFFEMQTRGRLRSERKIQEAAKRKPATFIAFDLLMMKGQIITGLPFLKRKEHLYHILQTCGMPLKPEFENQNFIQYLPYEKHFEPLWKKVKQKDGEGILAKQINSIWVEGKRTTHWVKVKNWKKVQCFITAFEKRNGFFHVAVYNEGKIMPIGLFKNGLKQAETKALVEIMKQNAIEENEQFIAVHPSICVELYYLQFHEDSLREPYFSQFLFHILPDACTINNLKQQTAENDFPVEITHPEKPLWDQNQVTKLDYINYLKHIYPYMSPFLRNRPLTVIRYPHGIFGEAFFQKNCPDYAPEFIETYSEEGIRYILCNNLETFLWLGNQLAIEFHIPFRPVEKRFPTEIVIDLDPPTKKDFPLAVEAAIYIKEDIINKLGLQAFVKVSGSRGIQIYFPLSGNEISWEDSRIFTEFIANFLLAKNEQHFTTERLKKNRGGRLYIDYIQYGQGKTIICPFSVRGNENAGVASPIKWEELTQDITPDGFSMEEVLKRIQKDGNPFESFFDSNNEEPLQEILKFLKPRYNKE